MTPLSIKGRLLGALVALALAAPVQAQSLTTTLVATLPDFPTNLTSPPGDASRLFVTVIHEGVYIIDNGTLLPGKFLDLSSEFAANSEGLVGLAFHPNYAVNGRFFVCYTDQNLTQKLVEYQVSADPDVADAGSAIDLITPFTQPDLKHSWNHIEFGPDGMLYVGTGDGGLPVSLQDESQDLNSLLGKMLRLDVDLSAPYIPIDNPFVGMAGVREEIWLYGLRNPWRFSFDQLTGDLFIADVGESSSEEIDFLPASSTGGENFGWKCMEGTTCAPCTCQTPAMVDPFFEYDHLGGCAIIGGYVYRGSEIPGLEGTYFFADLCTQKIWSLRYDGVTVTEFTDRSTELRPTNGSLIQVVPSFGQDSEGGLYILDRADGEIFKIILDPCPPTNYCTGLANSVGPGATMASSGSTLVANNDFALTCSGLVPNEFGLFYYGPSQISAPFGDGLRCVGSGGVGIFRFNPPQLVNGAGEITRSVDFTAPPADTGAGQITGGSTWNFQFWYRDPVGAGFNLSDGLSVVFCP